MAKLKGITLEISGDTTGLDKALQGVNKESNKLQSELRQVEKLLKLDPSNTELLAQKQGLLSNQVETTKEKLDQLKQAQAQVNEQFRTGKIGEEQYREFQREIIATEQKLKSLEQQVKENGKSFADLGDKVSGIGKKMSGVGGAMTAGVTTPLVGGLVAIAEGTSELANDLAKLETNAIVAGVGVEAANEAMRELSKVSDETDSNVEAVSNLLASGFDDNEMLEAIDALSGAVIKFPDTLKIEGLADGLEETLATGKGIGPFAEMIERLGYNLDDFDAGLEKAKKNGTETQYVLDFLAKTGLSEVNAEFQKNNEALIVNNQANYDLQLALKNLGDTLRPILSEVVQGLSTALTAFNELDSGTKKIILTFGGLVAILGPILTGVGLVTMALPTLGAAFAALSGPIGIAIVAITAAIAIGVAIMKNWDEIKAKCLEVFNSVKDTVKTVWDDVVKNTKAFISTMLSSIGTFLNNLVTSIRNFVPNMLQVGMDLFNGLWDGMKSIWDNLSSWVSDKCDWLLDKLMFWRKSESEMQSSKSDGSHRTGLNSVPFDGYRAILHKGERVLTEAENYRYTKGIATNRSGSVSVTQNIYSPTENPAEQQRRAAREFKRLALEV